MAKQVNPPRGMKDVLPQEKTRREWALGVIRKTYKAHGFDEIETPALENYDRLHSGLGGDNEKLSFSVLKRGLTKDALHEAADADNADQLADLGLRFDLTVPLTRYYATNRAKLSPVFKAIQIGPVWRAERPQKGRYRQFVQADIDIIGDDSALAEVELITATSTALAELGLSGCTIRMNDRRILTAMLFAAGFEAADHPSVLISVDKLDKIGLSGVSEELALIDQAAAKKLESALAAQEHALKESGIPLQKSAMLDVLPEGIEETGVLSLVDLGEALEGVLPNGVTLVFDPTLVRGMGYYTGTIFEVAHPSSGSSVGGGGRYDGMVGRFLGQDVPAVGFSIGFERIIDLVEVPHGSSDEIALVFDRDVTPQKLIEFKKAFIEKGHRVRLEKRQKNMKTLIQRLVEAGVQKVGNVNAETTTVEQITLRDVE